jgi:hypothetical protein
MALITIAGCGSSKPAATATTTPLPAAVVTYAQCLSVHGIAPSVTTPTTVAASRAAAAVSACASGRPAPSGANFRSCLRVYGVAPPSTSGTKSKLDPHYPLALQACGSLRKGHSTNTTAS